MKDTKKNRPFFFFTFISCCLTFFVILAFNNSLKAAPGDKTLANCVYKIN